MPEKYPIGIAGPDLNQISRDYTHLVATHEHFALAMVAYTWQAFLEALKETDLALLIIYADIAPNPDALREALKPLQKTLVILLLPASWARFEGVFKGADKVRKLYILPAAPKEVLTYGYSLIQTEMAASQSVSPLQYLAGAPGITAVGTRVIAFVSAQGGVGRSTLAEAVGFELAARRSIRSLLFAFDLPPAAPLRLGTRFAPSAAEFLQRTEGGFKDAIQSTADGLDVIIAPPDSTGYAGAAQDGTSGRIHDLIAEAYKFHYAAILLDLPSSESTWMLQPLRVATTVVLVSRPTTEGVRACGHLLKLLTEVVGAQHRFTHDAFFLVLNQRTPKSLYTVPAFASELAKYAGWTPPVIASVDYDPAIARAQDDTRPAASASDSLGRAAATLVDAFYGSARGAEPLRKSFHIGRVKIRTTE